MAEIFSAKKGKHKEDRKSVQDIKKTVSVMGGDHGLTSFRTYPSHVCFETQNEGEEVIVFLRQHPIVNLPWIIAVVFAFTLPSVFAFFPPYSVLPATYQVIVTMMWYLLVTGFALAKFMSWFFNIYIVTDERIVDVDFVNLFHREISTAKIKEIQDVSVKSSGAFETFFGFGSVFIQTAAEVTQFEFLQVPSPDKVGKIINQMIDLEEQEELEGRSK